MANINLFQEGDNQAPQRNGILPWAETPITLDYLQISKKEAQTNQAKVRALFYKYKMQKQNAVEAYTDGSLNKKRKKYDLCGNPPSVQHRRNGHSCRRDVHIYGRSIRHSQGHGDSIQLPRGHRRIGHLYRLLISSQSTGFPWKRNTASFKILPKYHWIKKVQAPGQQSARYPAMSVSKETREQIS